MATKPNVSCAEETGISLCFPLVVWSVATFPCSAALTGHTLRLHCSGQAQTPCHRKHPQATDIKDTLANKRRMTGIPGKEPRQIGAFHPIFTGAAWRTSSDRLPVDKVALGRQVWKMSGQETLTA